MNIEDLRETAALAHLNLSEAELAAAFGAFEEMLGYFAAMQAADNDPALSPGGPPAESAPPRFRPDDPAPAAPLRDAAVISRLLENPGERDGRFVVVPNVL